MEWIDYGLGGLTSDALDAAGADMNDLADLYGFLSARGEVVGYEATERFYEIGTPESLGEAVRFLRTDET